MTFPVRIQYTLIKLKLNFQNFFVVWSPVETKSFFFITWLLISLCAPTIGLLEDSYEKIGNLEEGDLPIEVANHSQHTFIQNIHFLCFNVLCNKCKKKPKIIDSNWSKDTLRMVTMVSYFFDTFCFFSGGLNFGNDIADFFIE